MELLQRSFHLRSCLRARMSWQRLWPKVRQKLLAQPGDCSTVDGMGRSRRRWNWRALRFPPAQVRRMDAKVLRLSCESARQSFREDKRYGQPETARSELTSFWRQASQRASMPGWA